MSSGVKVVDEVKNVFTKMKVRQANEAEEDRIRLLILHIHDDMICVEKCYAEKDLDEAKKAAAEEAAATQTQTQTTAMNMPMDTFKFLQSLLHKEECRYIVYDCHFETKESSKKEDLVYIMWTPETASIKSKMKYASSKSAIDKVLEGVKHRLQVNDLSDIDRKEFAEKLGNVLKLEGVSI